MALSDTYYVSNNAPIINNDIPGTFFPQDVISAANFSQLFPYQLMILRVQATVDSTGATKSSYVRLPYTFTLPIPPQDLTVDMPIATTVQATLNGIVEQNSGAPFRDIILAGTTGVTPVKNSASPQDTNSFSGQLLVTTEAIFAGTTSAINRTITSARNLVGVGTTPNVNSGLTTPGDTSTDLIPGASTGYYQFRLLERFIESYTELKKKSITFNGTNTKDLRLAFAMWKDESIYLCSGVKLVKKRTSSKPIEYMYTLQLRAWKRIKLDNGLSLVDHPIELVARTPNLVSTLVSRLVVANQLLQNANQIIQSIIPDASRTVTNIVRQVSLFLKNTANIKTSISDFPDSIKADLVPVLVSNWRTILAQIPSLGVIPPSILTTGLGNILNLTTISQSTIAQPTPANITTTNEINQIFDSVSPNDIPLTAPLVSRINDEQNRVQQFTRQDFESMRDQIQTQSAVFADVVGAGNTMFDETFNRSPVASQDREPTDDEWDILFALNEIASVLDQLAASGTIDPVTPNSMEYVAGLAQQSGIAFTIPQSKFAVPFPYGYTLEQLSKQYLSDANRWFEIATLNGLKAPYVDEIGFSLLFQTPGNGNTLYVNDVSNLYVNQAIYISANNISQNKRHITSINKIYDGFYAVTVDGNSDLDTYSPAQSAQLFTFLPNTVNSQMAIYIPSDKTAPEDLKTKAIPGIDVFDPLLQISGVDLLLTPSGDLVITPDGDCRLAFGLQNIIQQIKLAISTPQGSLLQHPQYGIGVPIGDSVADVDIAALLKNIQSMFSGDPTFSGVSSASVEETAGAINITLTVGIAALSTNVPITFQILK